MRGRQIACCLLAAGALTLACGGDDEPKPSGAPMARTEAAPAEEHGENQPPVIEQVVLVPPRPRPGNQIEARIEVGDPDGDPIRLQLEWRHGGRVIAEGAHTTIAPDDLRKGEEVSVLVVATDGRDESEPYQATARVGNQPPLIAALELAPDGEVPPGQEVTAVPRAQDPDGDALQYEFEWLLNGRPVRGADGAAFDSAKLERGDRLQARVRVGDGEDWSPVAESMVLELANRAPRIAGVPPIESVAGGIQAQLEAEDPDGDRSLRYRVIEAPSGLTVDAISGQLHWKPERGTTGTHAVEIAVADSFGAESALRFELTVSAESKQAPAPAKADENEAGDAEAAGAASESDGADDE